MNNSNLNNDTNYVDNNLKNSSEVSNNKVSLFGTTNEMDTTFIEPPKKYVGVIVTVILLLFIVLFGVGYYFIIDAPKKLFINNMDKFLPNLENPKYDKFNLEYWMNFNINKMDSKIVEFSEIIDNLAVYGTGGYDKNQELMSNIVDLSYNNNLLPTIQFLEETKENGNIYILLEKLYDKTILIERKNIPSKVKTDIGFTDYKILINSFQKILKESFETATYTKGYVKLNGKQVKKVSLIIDKKFRENFLNKVISNQQVVESYAKILNMTRVDIEEYLRHQLSTLSSQKENISIYLNIINNEFVMLETDIQGKQVKISKTDETYSFELSENYTLFLKVDVKMVQSSDDWKKLLINLDDVIHKTGIAIDIKYKIDLNKGIDPLDTENVITLDEITEEKLIGVFEKIKNNKGIQELLKNIKLNKKME